jgi:hypothetical protein
MHFLYNKNWIFYSKDENFVNNKIDKIFTDSFYHLKDRVIEHS